MARFTRPDVKSRVLLGLAILTVAVALVGARSLIAGARPARASVGVSTTEVTALAAQASSADAPSKPAVIVPVPLKVWGPAPRITSTAPAPAVSAWGAVVLDEASASVMYEKDAHARLAPASLTKIMTALVALERNQPNEMVDVTVDGRTMGRSTVMGLVPGERISLQALLYGLMLPSGNDAALAIAQHVGGSTERFVELMNKRAAELGLQDTNFTDPHGLGGPNHYTSAYDLALLTRAAMQREDFRQIADTKYITVAGELKTYQLGTLNPLYGRIPGVDGVKTGYTRSAQETFVGSVTRDGHRVYVVVLRSTSRIGDSLALLRWSFDSWSWASPPSVAASASPDGS